MAEENQTKNEDADQSIAEKKLIWPIVAVFVGIVVILLFYIIKFANNDWSSDPAEWAVFSDYLGGLASPIIALAVLVYVYNAFEVQRKELNETKKALEKTQKEQEKQTKIQQIVGKVAIQKIKLELEVQRRERYSNRVDEFPEKYKIVQKLIAEARNENNKAKVKDMEKMAEERIKLRDEYFEMYKESGEEILKLQESIIDLEYDISVVVFG